jgi:hypothetical protein
MQQNHEIGKYFNEMYVNRLEYVKSILDNFRTSAFKLTAITSLPVN